MRHVMEQHQRTVRHCSVTIEHGFGIGGHEKHEKAQKGPEETVNE